MALCYPSLFVSYACRYSRNIVMDHEREMLEQQLWELLYDLLSSAEADALRARIANEPAVAARWAEVRKQHEAVAAAVRWSGDEIVLAPPDQLGGGNAPVTVAPRECSALRVLPVSSATTWHPPIQWSVALNFVAAAAACLLVAWVGYVCFWSGSLLNPRSIALAEKSVFENHVRLVVTGPPTVSPDLPRDFHISAETVEGVASPTLLEYRFVTQDERTPQWRGPKPTDANGQVTLTAPAKLTPGPARLEVRSITPQGPPLAVHFRSEPPEYTTLARHKSRDELKETPHFRTRALRKFTYQAPSPAPERGAAADATTRMISESRQQMVVGDSVTAGALAIPANPPEGDDHLAMSDLDRLAVAGRHDASVRLDQLTEVAGVSELFRQSEFGLLTSQAAVANGAPNAHIQFVPEGGALVAEVENTVYFRAAYPTGEPVAVQGVVHDQAGRTVATFAADQQGGGAITFTPRLGRTYMARIDAPSGATRTVALPPSRDEDFVALHAPAGVIDAGEPLVVQVASRRRDVPLMVTAMCRDVLVAHRAVRWPKVGDPRAPGALALELPLPDEVAGIVRIAVHDFSQHRPAPLAQRLVLRRSARLLQFHVQRAAADHSLREPVEIHIAVTDEVGRSTPATLSVAIQDASRVVRLASLNGRSDGKLPLGYAFGANWDFRDAVVSGFDFFEPTSFDMEFALATIPLSGGASDEEHLPTPVVADNLAQVQPLVANKVADLHARRAAAAANFGRRCTLASGLLLVVLLVVGARRFRVDTRWWTPAVAASLLCLGLGAASVAGGSARPPLNLVAAPFPNHSGEAATQERVVLSSSPPQGAPMVDDAALEDAAAFALSLNRTFGRRRIALRENKEQPPPQIEALAVPTDIGSASDKLEADPLLGAGVASAAPRAAPAPDLMLAKEHAKAAAAAGESFEKQSVVIGNSAELGMPINPQFAKLADEGRVRPNHAFPLPGSELAASPPFNFEQGAERSASAERKRFAGKQSYAENAEWLLWRPNVATSPEGNTTFRFRPPAGTKQLRVIVQGHGAGRVGHAEVRIDLQTP